MWMLDVDVDDENINENFKINVKKLRAFFHFKKKLTGREYFEFFHPPSNEKNESIHNYDY